MTNWEAALRDLPDPVAPGSTVTEVMTRVRAIDGAPGSVPAAASGSAPRRSIGRWRAVTGIAGAVATSVAYMSRLLDGSEAVGFLSPGTGDWLRELTAWLEGDPFALLMIVGLACYLVSVTGPMVHRGDRR